MDRRFGHPGALGFTAEAERFLPGPHRHIHPLMRQAVMHDRRIPPRSFQPLSGEEIRTLRQAPDIPRDLRRSITPLLLQRQSKIIALLVELYKIAGTPLTADEIRVMITMRAALYADYWEFALREWTWPHHDDYNMAAVANALSMTQSELISHLRMVNTKRDAERKARAPQIITIQGLQPDTSTPVETVTGGSNGVTVADNSQAKELVGT
jgi:hypothetical protein